MRRGFAEFGVPERAPFVPGEVLVEIDPGAPTATRESFLGSPAVQRRVSVGNRVWAVVEARRDEGVRSAVRRLGRNPSVSLAEPNYLYEAAAAPNDPYFSRLWGLHNLGQSIAGSAGVPDADVDAVEAWDVTKGSASIRVAVLDSGVASAHPDLAPNMRPGWDFVDGDASPEDPAGHGTHVAATIGARGNDGFGVAGMAWNVGIVPVRVLGGDGFGSTDDIVRGVEYAAAQGVDVVNMSLGGPGNSQILGNAIAAHPDILFVVAAGNGGEDSVGDNNDAAPEYPCNYPSPNVICVAATDQTDRLSSFSNYGSQSVDLAAPGTFILSAAPAATDAFASGFEEVALPWVTGGTSEWSLVTDSLGTFASDSPFGPYANNTDSWLDSDLFSLAGRHGCHLDFWMYLDTELEYDGLLVEASTDGFDYTTIGGWTGWSEDWIPLSVSLSDYDGAPVVGISFRLLSDEDVVGDGADIDDVVVQCAASSYGANDFAMMDGTSMATPHVAGAAALLLSLDPTASVAEVKAALLGGVDRKSGLAGKVGSSGRLNVFNSLNLLAPPPTPSPTPPPSAAPTASPAPTPPSATAPPTASPTPTPDPVDTSSPVLTSVRDAPDPFSPDGDGTRDLTKVFWTSNEAATTNVTIYRRSGKRVRNLGTFELEAGGWSMKWNGRNGAGYVVETGTYLYEITATDAAGNTTYREGRVSVRL